jgi:hypothetical protein
MKKITDEMLASSQVRSVLGFAHYEVHIGATQVEGA